MKNGKILLLLVLILSMTVFLFACGDDAESEATDTSALTDSATTEDSVQGNEQEQAKHELHDYFVLDNEAEALAFAKISKYEGEIVDTDEENHLIAIKTQDLDVKNQVIDTITVYDVLTGEVIHEQSVTNLLYDYDEDRVDLDVEIDYPVIRVEKLSHSEDGDANYSISYYFAKKGSEVIRTTDKTTYGRDDFGNGLVAYNMGDEVVWIDRNMEIVRTVDAIAANGYDIDVFRSEYQGYLYSWSERTVQVFNRLGVCSGTYTMQHNGILNVHVLDNGNVLIQDLEEVDDYAAHDVILDNVYYKLTSLVMNYVDGTTTAVELDFLVDALETAYTQRYGEEYYRYLPFELATGHDNQAIIYRFANGEVSLYQEYVVLTNDLKVEYTLKNTTLGLDMYNAEVVNSHLYLANVYEGGGEHSYIFDLDGNMITPASYWEVTENYIVTDFGIYDHKMNLLYDLSSGDFTGGYNHADAANDRIYLSKHNFVTGVDETYVYDAETKAPKLINDGVDYTFIFADDGFYCLYDEETGEHYFCDVNGETKLIVWGYSDMEWFEDALVVEATFEGKSMVYVIQ